MAMTHRESEMSVKHRLRRKPHQQFPKQPWGTPNMGDILGALGEATAWRYKMLKTAFDRIGSEHRPEGWVTVNRRCHPPLVPHGKSLVDDGLMTLHRTGSKSSKTTTLSITEAGIKELARLEKRVRKITRRHAA